jgi:hypothetical protein
MDARAFAAIAILTTKLDAAVKIARRITTTLPKVRGLLTKPLVGLVSPPREFM